MTQEQIDKLRELTNKLKKQQETIRTSIPAMNVGMGHVGNELQIIIDIAEQSTDIADVQIVVDKSKELQEVIRTSIPAMNVGIGHVGNELQYVIDDAEEIIASSTTTP